MTLEVATPFLNDDSPKIRRAAISILADGVDPEATENLALLMADPAEEVFSAACDALLYRAPWLAIDPFISLPPSEKAMDSDEGKVWSGLQKGLERFIDAVSDTDDISIYHRWSPLPGAGALLVSLLEEKGKSHLAQKVTDMLGLFGSRQKNKRQALIAPTYRCNLDCSYCYTKGWDDDETGKGMTRNQIDTTLTWLSENGIDFVQLSGGEPTIFHDFEYLTDQAAKFGIAVWLTTNALYKPAMRPLIVPPRVEELIAHYEQETLAQKPERLPLFMENVATAGQAGVKLLFRYTITPTDERSEWLKMIEAAREVRVTQINYGFAFQNVRGNNTHFDFTTIAPEKFENLFLAFVDDVLDAGLSIHQSKPFPLCLLTKEALRRGVTTGAINGCCTVANNGATQNITVNPDLTLLACNGIAATIGAIGDGRNLDQVGADASESIARLQMTPSMPDCNDCVLFYRGLCQGVCLAERACRSGGDD